MTLLIQTKSPSSIDKIQNEDILTNIRNFTIENSILESITFYSDSDEEVNRLQERRKNSWEGTAIERIHVTI